MSYLTITGISKYYNHQAILKHINVEIAEGEIVSLLGPSGSGKTTLLRIIAGLSPADKGQILLKGRNMATIPSHSRRFGMMFQEFALFPHKNVLGNVIFGLQMQGMDEKKRRDRAGEMLDLVGLSGFEKRNVAELSGGERQRVALARSLAPQPHILMLDEPLGALDRTLRQRLMMDLIQILRQVHVTTIFVTHDQSEAFAMADTIAVMDSGRIEQIASPEMLYRFPTNVRVARFLGIENLLAATVTEAGMVETPLGTLGLNTEDHDPGSRVTVLLRSENVLVWNGCDPLDPDSFLIEGKVMDCIFLGYCYRLHLETKTGDILKFDLPNDTVAPDLGADLRIAVRLSMLTIIRPE